MRKLKPTGKSRWLFSVIYDFDTYKGDSVRPFQPPNLSLWKLTEQGKSEDGDGQHRKYCAVLTEDEFKNFLTVYDYSGHIYDTMGMLGAPGFGIGITPAWCIEHEGRGYNDPLYASVYVFPFLVNGKDELVKQPEWESTKEIIEKFL